jgi:hypothetical protein
MTKHGWMAKPASRTSHVLEDKLKCILNYFRTGVVDEKLISQ